MTKPTPSANSDQLTNSSTSSIPVDITDQASTATANNQSANSATTHLTTSSIATATKSTQDNRKLWIGLTMIGLGLLIAIGITYAVAKMMSKEETPVVEEPVKKKVAEPLNVIPIAERPVLYIAPQADGRNIELVVTQLNKPATEVEYEIEYQAGSLLQGVFGTLELTSFPSKKTLLMGSCSAGGACTYHTDVKGGTILTRFTGGDSGYALKHDWRYIDNTDKAETLTSRDAKFSVTSDELKSARYLIITNSPGHPADLPGELISDIYVLQSSTPIKGDLTVSIRASEEGGGQIVAWDGSEWLTLNTSPDPEDTKTMTAITEGGWLFAVVR